MKSWRRLYALSILFLGSFVAAYFLIAFMFIDFEMNEKGFPLPIPAESDEFSTLDSSSSRDLNKLLMTSVRILCLCVTSAKFHKTRAIYVKATWGRRCTKMVFVSDETDARLGAIGFTGLTKWSELWAKTRLAFKWAHDNHINDFDWFVKADDDTFLVMENLRYLLSGFDPNKAWYLGRHFMSGDDPLALPKPPEKLINYASGGSAYVLSWKALAKLVGEAFSTPLYCAASEKVKTEDIKEDIEMGRCLASVGVYLTDTRDEQGRQRFFPFAPERHLVPGGVGDDDWIRVHDGHRYVEGIDCCSDTAISFHYVPAGKMLQLEYLLYRLRPVGYNAQSANDLATNFDKIYNRLQKNNYVIKHLFDRNI